MAIKFGTAGIGPVKDVENTFEEYKVLGIKAAEIPFTYGIFITKESDMKKVRDASEKFDIQLSIHAPYWINLNSKDKVKVAQSKQRILKCCEVGNKVGAYRVVFHAGFYAGKEEQETYENIKNQIIDMHEFIKNKNWKIKLAPETMGKINVFGSVEQISQLVKDTDCEFCIDFAHILARERKVDFNKIKKFFPQKKWHCHFSGIAYGDKGEKHHKKTEKQEWEKLLENLPKDKEIIIINESPDPFGDTLLGVKVWKGTD
ncbi:MAG: TIM barrel protein [archaeon]